MSRGGHAHAIDAAVGQSQSDASNAVGTSYLSYHAAADADVTAFTGEVRMKSEGVTSILAITLLAVAMPLSLAAQNKAKHENGQHHHYQIIDIGTFGGPNSSLVGPPPSVRLVNNSGAAVGGSDTSTPDPQSCWNFDCYLSYGFKWQEGVVHKLEALPGFNSSFTFWVSDSGLVAGISENGIDPLTGGPALEAILWGKDGSLTDLGTLGGNESTANAVNNRGQVGGGALNTIPDPNAGLFFVPGATQVHAFLWTKAHGMQDLGTLGGTDSTALFINERGQIAGWSFTNTQVNPNLNGCLGTALDLPTLAPFLWTNGKMIDLGTLGGTCGAANALNNRGQVVGFSDLAGDLTEHPFLWSESEGMKDLGALGGDYGHANYINDDGDIVGYIFTADSQGRAFLWRHGVMTNLGSLGSDPASEAYGVNSRGQVVGNTFILGGDDLRAFLWEEGGPMTDLNTLVPPNPDLELTRALYINDRGEIAAQGNFSNGDIHAFVLIPCDENHSDVAGCDYDWIDAVTAESRVSPASANQRPTRLNRRAQTPGMLNRLRGVQQAPVLGTLVPDAKQALLANSGDDLAADHMLAPPAYRHRGYCQTNSSGLTGYCAAFSYTSACSVGRSTACPRGQKAKKAGYYQCSLMQKIFADLRASCAF